MLCLISYMSVVNLLLGFCRIYVCKTTWYAHGRHYNFFCAPMMHYSNWLIDLKNRASLRNACKTSQSTDWNNRGNAAEMQNNNPQPREKTAHLWRKGKDGSESQLCLISGPAANKSPWLAAVGACFLCFILIFSAEGPGWTDRSSVGLSFQFPQVRVEGEGVLRYQGDGHSANRAHSEARLHRRGDFGVLLSPRCLKNISFSGLKLACTLQIRLLQTIDGNGATETQWNSL